MANTANAGKKKESTFTPEQVRQFAAQNNLTLGLGDSQFIDSNPDTIMGILNDRLEYRNATTPEQRALSYSSAQAKRRDLGYSGGEDGNQYIKLPTSPDDFSYDAAPSFGDTYGDKYNSQLDKVLNYGSFSYDPATDPLYQNYRKQYTREGQRATEDVMAQAAAMSGGLPSSYAATAAGQTANYYAAQMTDKIPELQQIAYNQYLNGFDMNRNKLTAAQAAREFDYQNYLTNLGQYNTDRNFAYQNLLDEISDQESKTRLGMERAQLAAQYNDYLPLREMGIDTSNYKGDLDDLYRAYQLAEATGDYSPLEAMGVDTTEMKARRQYEADQRQYNRDQWNYNRSVWDNNLAAQAAANQPISAIYKIPYGSSVEKEQQKDLDEWRKQDKQLPDSNFVNLNDAQYGTGGGYLLSTQSSGHAVESEVKKMRANGKSYEEINDYIDAQVREGKIKKADALTLRAYYSNASM